MTEQQNKQYTDLNKAFCDDYNARVQEINDEFGGIFDEECLEDTEEITLWFNADRSIVCQERNLKEIWNSLVILAGLECIVSSYVLY